MLELDDHHVPVDALQTFSEALLAASGAPADIGTEVARHLVGADAAGHRSHGVIHLPRYLREVESGQIVPDARPTVTRRTTGTASVDGHQGFGHFAAKFATELSIADAQEHGIAAVSVLRAGHVGRLGEYSDLAARQGCVTIVFTAPMPGSQVVPPGGAQGVLGTNPISIGFPDGRPDPFLMDFATSQISGGKVWLALQQGEELPEGVLWAPDMTTTRDPAWLQKGALYPPFGGHKGYGLAVAIALLAGALTGGGEETVGGGTLIVTIDAGAFVGSDLVASLADAELTRIKGTKRLDPAVGIVLPGEPEAEARAIAATAGIQVTDVTWTELLDAAGRLGVDPSPIVETTVRTSATAASPAGGR